MQCSAANLRTGITTSSWDSEDRSPGVGLADARPGTYRILDWLERRSATGLDHIVAEDRNGYRTVAADYQMGLVSIGAADLTDRTEVAVRRAALVLDIAD